MKKPGTAAESVADVKRRFRTLFDKVNGAPSPVPEREVERVREMFREHKDLELWRSVPGPGQAPIDYLLQQRMAGAAMSEAWRERVGEMRRDLGYEESPAAEQMLISHAVLCWLQLAFIELKYAYVIHEGMAPAQGRLWDRRVSMAQRRFTRALTELTRLRALTAAARYATARADVAEAEVAAHKGPRALRASPMAWETRGGRRYYYRKVWKEGRCFSVYEGGGVLAELQAERDEGAREQARRVSLDTRAELAALDAVDAMIDREWQTVKAAADAALEAAGYHRHKRQWRLRRGEAKAAG